MVRNSYSVCMMAFSVLTSTVGRAEVVVRYSRVLSPSPVQIKPCQPAYVSLEVMLDGWSDEKVTPDAPDALAGEVVINGQSYSFGFNSNPVVLFELDRDTIERPSRGTIRFNVVGTLFYNARDRDYVFREPGKYDVRFRGGAHLVVRVDAPSALEEAFLKEIEREDRAFVAMALGSDPQASIAMLPKIEGLLKKYRGTEYAVPLSIIAGQLRLKEVVEEYRSRDSSDLAGLARRRVGIMREYFEPHAHSIKSPNEVTAAYMLAQGLLDEVKHNANTEEVTGKRAQATELLRRVAGSPFSLQRSREAKVKLAGLEVMPLEPEVHPDNE